MNWRDELLKELSKEEIEKMIVYLKKDFFRFDQLMYLFLRNEDRITQRAASLIAQCLEIRPWFINHWLIKLLPILQNTETHVGIKRNILRFLQYATISEDMQGIVVDTCFGYLQSANEPVAVKVFSMTVLANICKKHPDLAHELKLSIETQLPFASAGFRSRANKILKNLK